ncbi:MAG: RNA-binding domain-containing protein [Phascolarctobacterium sp.]
MVESNKLEYKREYTDDIKYTVMAFANTDGGKLYIGINDDGEAVGVSDIDGTMLKTTNMIRDAIRPDVTLFTDCRPENIAGKTVLIVTVQRGTARPYYLASKGVRPVGVYVRQGASSVPASEAAIFKMLKETSGDSYEQERSLNQELTFAAASAFFAKKQIEFGLPQMRSMQLINEDGTYNNLALLLSDQCPHSLKIAVFQGSGKSTFLDRREFAGSLLQQLEDASAYIALNNRLRADFAGLYRIDRYAYPPEALREALLNIIVHREYGINGPALISIFDDRMEFVNIGGLVQGMSLEDILLGVSALRNKHLADVFYRLHLIEAYGTGLLKIKEGYLNTNLEPRIEATNNAFKVTLPNRNFAAPSQKVLCVKETQAFYGSQKSKEAKVLELVTKQGSVSRKDIQQAMGISQASAITLLRSMLEQGKLQKEGAGRFQRYHL